MNGGLKQRARILDSVQADMLRTALAAHQAASERAEARCTDAWSAVARMAALPEHHLRDNLPALLEIRDMVDRMMDAARQDGGGQ